MTTIWISILVTALLAAVFKATGPLLLGRRQLAPKPQRVLALLTPAILTALIVTGIGASGWRNVDLTLLAGVATIAAAAALRLPILIALFAGVLVTALIRLACA